MAAQKGNTYSSKNNRLLTDTLRRAALENDALKLRQGCDAIMDKAADGDLSAMAFVFDRLEGKPVNKTELSGDPDNPLNIFTLTERRIVRPGD